MPSNSASRRDFLKGSLGAAAGASLVGVSDVRADRPKVGYTSQPAAQPSDTQPTGQVRNILWICTDQQRWDSLGVTGNRFVHTPNLDRLANEGVLFERAYCNNPVCMPSRSSFLSGLYPTTCEVTRNGHHYPDKLLPRLMTHRLNRLGYNQGLAGKLHIRADYDNQASPESGYDHGYDEFNWSPCGYPAKWAGCQYQHWLRDLGVDFDVQDREDTKHVQTGMPAEHHQTTWCARRAITFMQAMAETQPNQPWSFACNIFDPHNPNDPPPELLERYLDRLDDIPLPNYKAGELDDKPELQRVQHNKADKRMPPHPLRYDDLTDREHRLYRASYYAMVDLIDQQVGRILDALDETGQRDNTLVIFTSDHGESLGDHGLYWKGPWFYEESMRVPLIMTWPGMKPRTRRVRQLAELVDIVPTIYDALGTDKPGWLQGHSWWGFFNGANPMDRDFAFAEMRSEHEYDVAMVRGERYKLVRYYESGQGELYDLEAQPLERDNRFDDPDLAEVQRGLQAAMDRRRAELKDARV
jgi:arylsulfatase A-like enzyme